MAGIRLVGGAALALRYFDRGTTQDLDSLHVRPGSDEAVAAAAARVARRHDWDPAWLNFEVTKADALPTLGRAVEWESIYDQDGISIQVASKEALLAMKLRANRPGRDTRDMRLLFGLCQINTLEDAGDLYEEFYPGDGPFQTDACRTDIVVVAPDGSITIVECKLDNNPQVRREIVGQLFDYASRLGETTADEFDAQWSRRTGSSLFGFNDFTDIDLAQAVKQNLAAGRFRLVLAVDVINPQLKRIVEYLNRITRDDTTIVAVEYARYVDGDVEILTPQTYGEDLAEVKTARQVRDSQTWSFDDFVAWTDEYEPASTELLEHLGDALVEANFLFRSGHSKKPAASYVFTTAEGFDVKPIQLSIMDTLERSYVTVELNFSQWAERWRADGNDERAVQTLQERWATIPALAEAMTHILAGEGARRSIPLAKFDEGSQRKAADALRAFTSTV